MFSARASELVELRNEVLEPTEITCKGAKDRDVPALFSYSRFEWEGSSYYKIDIIDISQRKALEETLVIYKERLDVAVNGAGIGIWEWDLINDEFFWDHNTYSIYGIERDSLSSVVYAWSYIVVPEDLGRVNQEVDFAIEHQQLPTGSSVSFRQYI